MFTRHVDSPLAHQMGDAGKVVGMLPVTCCEWGEKSVEIFFFGGGRRRRQGSCVVEMQIMGERTWLW